MTPLLFNVDKYIRKDYDDTRDIHRDVLLYADNVIGCKPNNLQQMLDRLNNSKRLMDFNINVPKAKLCLTGEIE